MIGIYLSTRDANIYDLYPQATAGSVLEFNAAFAKAVDDCAPPFWTAKEDDTKRININE